MTDTTYALLQSTLLLTCTMTICALVLLLFGGDPITHGFGAYKTAQELIALGALTLLIGTIASAVAEELTEKK